MKDRSLRRHQEYKAKRKSQETYNSCLGELSPGNGRVWKTTLEN